jgi:uncharacterized membrane protein HdeD (DUF308 family)
MCSQSVLRVAVRLRVREVEPVTGDRVVSSSTATAHGASHNPRRRSSMVKSVYSSLLWRGLLAIAVGILSVVWPGITVGAFVIVFAVYAILAAGTDVARAFSSDRAGPVVGYLLLALISLAAGVVALVWPDITAYALTIWVAAWALVAGIIEVAMAFRSDERAGGRAMWALSGLVSVALGAVLAYRPDIGALTLATVFGLFSIFYGITALTLAAQARRVVKATAGGRLTHVAA